MAALAESLVDEWLNRQRFFTVRGVKRGVDEIDLLAVRPSASGLEAWHVEVQASFRPISYISPVAKEVAARFGAKGSSAKRRPSDILEASVRAWIQKKFLSLKKRSMREEAWPKLEWKFVLVHAESRWPEELKCIGSHGVTLVSLTKVLAELHHDKSGSLRGGAGTDIAELMEYFTKHVQNAMHLAT